MSSDSSVISSRSKPSDLVTIKVLLNGSAISGEYRILGLNVSKGFNKIATARIAIADGNPAKQDFEISSNDDSLKPGAEIELLFLPDFNACLTIIPLNTVVVFA